MGLGSPQPAAGAAGGLSHPGGSQSWARPSRATEPTDTVVLVKASHHHARRDTPGCFMPSRKVAEATAEAAQRLLVSAAPTQTTSTARAPAVGPNSSTAERESGITTVGARPATRHLSQLAALMSSSGRATQLSTGELTGRTRSYGAGRYAGPKSRPVAEPKSWSTQPRSRRSTIEDDASDFELDHADFELSSSTGSSVEGDESDSELDCTDFERRSSTEPQTSVSEPKAGAIQPAVTMPRKSAPTDGRPGWGACQEPDLIGNDAMRLMRFVAHAGRRRQSVAKVARLWRISEDDAAELVLSFECQQTRPKSFP